MVTFHFRGPTKSQKKRGTRINIGIAALWGGVVFPLIIASAIGSDHANDKRSPQKQDHIAIWTPRPDKCCTEINQGSKGKNNNTSVFSSMVRRLMCLISSLKLKVIVDCRTASLLFELELASINCGQGTDRSKRSDFFP